MSKQVYYYDSKGQKYKGRIRTCDMCEREELVTVYNKKTRCKWCASKMRKDAIKDDEIFLPQQKGKYKLRGVILQCEKCKKTRAARKDGKRKTNLCPSCAVSEAFKKKMTGRFGKLNYGYKNGIGTYIPRGRKKNGGRCLACNAKERIHIHHVDKDRTNNEDKNLMPLCHSCHTTIHWRLRKGLSSQEAFNHIKLKKSSLPFHKETNTTSFPSDKETILP